MSDVLSKEQVTAIEVAISDGCRMDEIPMADLLDSHEALRAELAALVANPTTEEAIEWKAEALTEREVSRQLRAEVARLTAERDAVARQCRALVGRIHAASEGLPQLMEWAAQAIARPEGE